MVYIHKSEYIWNIYTIVSEFYESKVTLLHFTKSKNNEKQNKNTTMSKQVLITTEKL